MIVQSLPKHFKPLDNRKERLVRLRAKRPDWLKA